MPPLPLRFGVGAVLGALLVFPGTQDETPGTQAALLLGAAVVFGLFSVRKMSRLWDMIGQRRGGS